MDEKTFLATKVSNCKKCGNKIKPSIYLDRDMGATHRCPEIECTYCNITTGVYWPSEHQRCIDEWEKANS